MKLIQDYVRKEMINYLGKDVEIEMEVMHGVSYNHQIVMTSSK